MIWKDLIMISIMRILSNMTKKGELQRISKGKYCLKEHERSTAFRFASIN